MAALAGAVRAARRRANATARPRSGVIAKIIENLLLDTLNQSTKGNFVMNINHRLPTEAVEHHIGMTAQQPIRILGLVSLTNSLGVNQIVRTASERPETHR